MHIFSWKLNLSLEPLLSSLLFIIEKPWPDHLFPHFSSYLIIWRSYFCNYFFFLPFSINLASKYKSNFLPSCLEYYLLASPVFSPVCLLMFESLGLWRNKAGAWGSTEWSEQHLKGAVAGGSTRTTTWYRQESDVTHRKGHNKESSSFHPHQTSSSFAIST